MSARLYFIHYKSHHDNGVHRVHIYGKTKAEALEIFKSRMPKGYKYTITKTEKGANTLPESTPRGVNPVRKKTARKKKRSPAQRANDKRLGAMAKKRAAKKRPRKKKTAKKRARNPRSTYDDWVIFSYFPENTSVSFLQVNSAWGGKAGAVRFTTKTLARNAIQRIYDSRQAPSGLMGMASASESAAAIRADLRERFKGKG